MGYRKKATLIAFLTLVMLTVATATAAAASVRTASAEGRINAKGGAIVRSAASTSSKNVGGIKNNAKVHIKKEVFTSKSNPKATNKWYYVSYGDVKGYVRSDLIDNIKYNTASAKLSCDLNVRTGPTTSFQKKGALKSNRTVEIALPAYYNGSSTTWYKIKYGNDYMYLIGRVEEIPKSAWVKTASLKYPERIDKGHGFSIGGTITSNRDIEKVTAKILNAEGKSVLEKSAYPDTTSYSLASLDKYIKFGSLEEGEYNYVVTVKVLGKTYTKINRTFEVEANRGDLIAEKALELAWSEDTSPSLYTYGKSGARATDAFRQALDEQFPTHKNWSGGGPAVGASCDVFVGTVVRSSGYDESFPRGLEQQWPYLQKSDKWQRVDNFNGSVDTLENGDVIIYRRSEKGEKLKGHIFLYYKNGEKEGYAEASLNKTYGHLVPGRNAVQSKLNKSYIKAIEVYRAV